MQHREFLVVATLAMLLGPALANGFPLIFPDTAPYLGPAYANAWTHDRSGFYGLILLPILKVFGGVPGLWVVIALQAAIMAIVLHVTLWKLLPGGGPGVRLAIVAVSVLGTALPWHTSQLMPDAFTGLVVLLTWLAIKRDPAASGSPLIWFAAILTAVMHVTHIALMASTAAAVLLCQWFGGQGVRKLASRAVAAVVALVLVAGIQIAGNGVTLGRWSISPAGPVFLFARLNEDGLIKRWAERHCVGADTPVCRLQSTTPRESQDALWAKDSPIARHVWFSPPQERWRWVDMIGEANQVAIRENPLAFAGSTLRGGAVQLARFRTLDDLCPLHCATPDTTFLLFFRMYRPDMLPAVAASPQVRGELPKILIRAITFPITLTGQLLLVVVTAVGVRRRDGEAVALSVAVVAAILVNALLAGGLSEVNDRYQSRIVWLAPFVVMILLARWYGARARRKVSRPLSSFGTLAG